MLVYADENSNHSPAYRVPRERTNRVLIHVLLLSVIAGGNGDLFTCWRQRGQVVSDFRGFRARHPLRSFASHSGDDMGPGFIWAVACKEVHLLQSVAG